MCRELGVFNLDNNARLDAQEKCRRFLLSAPRSEAVDFIEMACWVVAQLPDLTEHDATPGVQMKPEEAIEELNDRFKDHCVGYQFVGDEIVRVDSQYIHAEAVKPAILLLNTAGFDGALEEFLSAHEHYRKGKMKEAMSDALKAFREHHEGNLPRERLELYGKRHREIARKDHAGQRADTSLHGDAPRGTPYLSRGRFAHGEKQEQRAWAGILR
jgi:hypothetical protein